MEYNEYGIDFGPLRGSPAYFIISMCLEEIEEDIPILIEFTREIFESKECIDYLDSLFVHRFFSPTYNRISSYFKAKDDGKLFDEFIYGKATVLEGNILNYLRRTMNVSEQFWINLHNNSLETNKRILENRKNVPTQQTKKTKKDIIFWEQN